KDGLHLVSSSAITRVAVFAFRYGKTGKLPCISQRTCVDQQLFSFKHDFCKLTSESQDLRSRILDALECVERPTDITARLEVSRMWMCQVCDRFQRSSLQMSEYHYSRVARMEQTLRGWI